ncbi:tetratricopeptide repeat protein [Campylobacter sp. VBCF_06 NA8]|uniref:tetratricopeptide repeat protein n=1 Tax=Campylobacter sp. VBCF_06 NA8 TaxID=2983822 RepID=UPI0022EA0B77|nr:tetratricopeptide repeat protein [Campylobacter sp. VBCF_06 NA8]MDA3047122.1 tetratricopeptide repeat protein [Campylobacter sp. VBCF_06 NA8]
MTNRILIAIFALFSALCAEPYSAYSNDAVMKKNPNGGANLDIAKLYEYSDALCKHACEYPLKFDSEDEAEQGYNDSVLMASVFEYINKEIITDKIDAKDRTQFDMKFAQIYVSQHNFDVLGAKEKADAIYERILARDSQNAEVLTTYGEFLLNSTRTDKAKEILSRAAALGAKRPYLALAAIELMNQNNAKGIEYLEIYCAEFKDDEKAKTTLEGLKSGDIIIEKIER